MALNEQPRQWSSPRSSIRAASKDSAGSTKIEGRPGFGNQLLACPYLKHNPCEYEKIKSCSKTGWTTIHGLRQHVYRCHILPIKCPGCFQTFESSCLFADHLHETFHCNRSVSEDDEPTRGLESLLQKIRSPGPIAGTPSEEEMWKVLYLALFPNDAKHNLPTPYYKMEQGTPKIASPCDSNVSLFGETSSQLIRVPEPVYSGNSPRRSHTSSDTGSVSSDSIAVAPRSTQPFPIARGLVQNSHSGCFDEKGACVAGYSVLSDSGQIENQPTKDTNDSSTTESIVNLVSGPHQSPKAPASHLKMQDSNRRKLKKKLRKTTLEAQVLAFRAWEKPHRTDEHITPGVYQKFLRGLARCLTFWVPSWFLKHYLKMNDLRQRLAFRQKVLCCVLLAAVYILLSYFLIIQPIASCVVKVDIGMIQNDGAFCKLVSNIIYVYMGLGGGFMVLVAFCVARVRYTKRAFEEHRALLVMQIPCYNEDEATLRKTIESCVQSSYEKKRKLLFIVADGTIATTGQKPTYQILLEDILDHKADLEAGIDTQAHSYTSFDSDGASKNMAYCCTGHYRGVPYVVVIKVGRDDEQGNSKPGNRGKRDSQLLCYNFFHYVNYRRFWDPLFENLEFKMRICLNIDAQDATYMLAIDCDTVVDRTGISYLVDRLERDPKLVGVCGYTGVGNAMSSFVASSQVFEYWLTHAVLKAVESVCCSVFVLSGCFTIYRLKWANDRPAILHPLLLEDYAGSYDKTLHEHNLLSIGEDRYLSTLAIRYFGSDCRLQYFSAATCTTMVPEKLSVLLDQRRRWNNSLIHCHFAHLNVRPFELSFFTHARILFVIFAELFMVLILPLALPAGLALAVISVLLTPYAWAILLAFTLIPVLLCVLCMDWTYIPFYLPFFPMIGIFSIVIPIFSLWNQDNIRWGKTRGG